MDEITRKCIEDFDIPNPFRNRAVADFVICVSLTDLRRTMNAINSSGYRFIGATQNGTEYTVFFWRGTE